MFLFHIHTFAEFYLLSLFYFRILKTIPFRITIQIFSISFMVISAICLWKGNSIYEFNSIQRYVEMLLLTIILFSYLYERTHSQRSKPLGNDPYLWLTIGYIVYFFGTLLLFVLRDQVITDPNFDYWIIHGIFNIFLNGILTFVLWNGRVKSLS